VNSNVDIVRADRDGGGAGIGLGVVYSGMVGGGGGGSVLPAAAVSRSIGDLNEGVGVLSNGAVLYRGDEVGRGVIWSVSYPGLID